MVKPQSFILSCNKHSMVMFLTFMTDLSVYCINKSNIQVAGWVVDFQLFDGCFDYSVRTTRSRPRVESECGNFIKNCKKNCTKKAS